MMRHSIHRSIPLLVILIVMIALTGTLAQLARVDHADLANHLYELQHDHTTLANEVLLSRGGRRADYRGVVQAANHLTQNVEGFAERVAQGTDDLSERLHTAATNYISAVRPFLRQIEDFKTANTVEHNSLNSLAALADEAVALATDDSHAVLAEIEKLLQEVLVYSVDGGLSSQAKITTRLRQFRQLESQVDAEVATVLARMEKHVEKLLEVRPQLDQQMDAIIESQSSHLLARLMGLIAERDSQNEYVQRMLQLGLIVASAALLGYVGTSLWQLRRAVQELDAANNMLEQTIEMRAAELKLQGQQLHQAQKLESIGQLAAGIAHEINTPMQFVHDNVEFLSDCSHKLFAVVETYQRNLDKSGPNLDWEQRAADVAEVMANTNFDLIHREVPIAIEESLEGIRRVIHIVRAMKEFSHPGQESRVGVDLNNAVKSTVTIARNRWKYAADLELDLDPDLPTLPCVPAEINQVLLNLIVNAADAIVERFGENSAQKGRITVRTRRSNDDIVIEVADTGCGIPDSIRDRIFDPFFTTKDVGKGTGQGLAICYNVIVNKHCGRLHVESGPGEGTRFIVTIPLTDGRNSKPEESDDPTEPAIEALVWSDAG